MRIFPDLSVRSIGLMVVRVVLIAYVVYGALLILRQDALLYFPDQIPFEHSGYSWLFVEYGGYACDGKKTNTASVLRDAEHVVSWIRRQEFTSVAVIGESVGSGPASYHASLAEVDKLILITPFVDMTSVARSYFPIYPIALMLRDDFDNGAWAAHAKRVLVIHGTADTIIPFSFGKALFDILPQEQKELLVLPGTDHNDAPALFQTQSTIMKFLQEE